MSLSNSDPSHEILPKHKVKVIQKTMFSVLTFSLLKETYHLNPHDTRNRMFHTCGLLRYNLAEDSMRSTDIFQVLIWI